MLDGSIPPASIYSTWVETVEVWSIDNDTLYDFSGVVDVILRLQDQLSRFEELIITMRGGSITLPAPGIVQWRVEAPAMFALRPKLYKLIMVFQTDTDITSLILGTVSVVE